MNQLLQIPELQSLQSPSSLVRIPQEIDVPVTDRVMRLVDSAAFRRLARVSQLGLVATVYPGATHTRFEHSLGVYRNALLYLQRLTTIPEFQQQVSVDHAHLFLVSALLHDVGHFPFCHLIEDMQILGMQRHEAMASLFLESDSIAQLLLQDWGVQAKDVCELLSPLNKKQPRYPLLSSLLSGPIDVDKLDYLDRDSLHAGVPYGRNFDRSRLISQLCLTPDGQSLAITEKGRTAAEMMVFARYVMFSEVYWHHTVRAATAMLQRAIWGLLSEEESTVESPMGHFVNEWGKLSEQAFIGRLRTLARNTPHADLVEGLFGDHRSIYKCVGEYHCQESPALHTAIARRPYSDLQDLAYRLSEKITRETCIDIQPHELIIDAPPPKLEVQFKIEVRQSSGKFVQLGDLSPVIQTLTTQQFDNLVKRVRIFVKPELRKQLENRPIQEYLSSVLS
jgi:uncharacterized protein